MKILQVIEFFTPSRGGSVIVPYNISKQLAKKGHDVTILTTDFEFDENFAKLLEHVTVIPFHCKANFSLFLYSPDMKNWLKKNIEKFDIIHLHNFRSYQNIIVSKYAKKNIPYILQAHGSSPYNGKTILKKSYDKFYGYNLLQSASKCIALNEMEKQQYQQIGVREDTIEIIPNGIDLSDYENLPERGIFRKKYGINDDEKVVLYLGRLHKIKGLDLLVDAFSDLVKRKDNVKLVIIGPDEGYLTILKRQIDNLALNDKVLLTGPLYGNDKLSAYVDADVYVLPSRYEIFGITALEACACGTPVIVTDCCGIADFVDKIGCAVEYDKSQLTESILKLFESDELRAELEAKGKKLMKEKFNWGEIVKKVENIYQECISPNN